MMSESEFTAIQSRLAAVTGDVWGPVERDGVPVVLVRFADGSEAVMRVTRDRMPASADDVEFIGHARRDIDRLLGHIRGSSRVSEGALDEIESRCDRASPPPWKVFLEAEGGIGGSNVIWVSERDDEPDLYLWLDDRLAPDADFEFVAAARQDVPALVATTRRRPE